MNKITCLVLILFLSVSARDGAEIKNSNSMKRLQSNRDSIIVELKTALYDDINLWYPLVVDKEFGGYFSDVNYKWELSGRQNKMIVQQARHVWSLSNAYEYYNDKKYLEYAKHGFEFLRDVMWDKEYSGFYDLVDREGNIIKSNGQIIKKAYGNTFALYGLAAYYRASGDTSALNLALQTFKWFEQNSYDAEYGGYFQFITREGKPFVDGFQGTPPKDQNSMIHILEAFTELYKVWPNELLKERLSALLQLIRDVVTTEAGYMNLFFDREMRHVSFRDLGKDIKPHQFELDHVSFGHDVEIAYLMLETSHLLGIENDTTTMRVAINLVDHSIKFGFDKINGGLFDRGFYFLNEDKPEIIKKSKEWWAQYEALNSFLLMSQLQPSKNEYYYDLFVKQWHYIKNYIIDSEQGGSFWGGIDIEYENNHGPKGTIWKINYHSSRALINCIRQLGN
jgi:mannobiose 2-epimerase